MPSGCGLKENAVELERASGALQLAFSDQSLRRFFQSGSAKAFLPSAYGQDIEVVFANTAGGLADGDVFTYELNADKNSHIAVTTQAAERVYKALRQERARSSLVINATCGSKVSWLPHETILYDGSHFAREINVSLDKSSTVVLGEILVFGRQASGEIMTKGYMQDHWQIKRDGVLIHAEAFRIKGDIRAVLEHRAGADQAGVMATLFMIAPDDLNPVLAAIRRQPVPEGAWIETSLWEGKLVVRILAPSLYLIKSGIGAILEKMISSPLPRAWAL